MAILLFSMRMCSSFRKKSIPMAVFQADRLTGDLLLALVVELI